MSVFICRYAVKDVDARNKSGHDERKRWILSELMLGFLAK